MLLGHESSQVVGVLLQEGLVLEHVANSLGNGHFLRELFPEIATIVLIAQTHSLTRTDVA